MTCSRLDGLLILVHVLAFKGFFLLFTVCTIQIVWGPIIDFMSRLALFLSQANLNLWECLSTIQVVLKADTII